MSSRNSFVFVIGGTHGVGKASIECLLRKVCLKDIKLAKLIIEIL